MLQNEGKARVENMILPCTSELCNYISYQVEMVRYSHNCFVIWRPIDTISAQTMARHQSRV